MSPPVSPPAIDTSTRVTGKEILLWMALGVPVYLALVVWFIISVIRYLQCSHDDPKRFQWVKDIKGQAIALFLSACVLGAAFAVARLLSLI